MIVTGGIKTTRVIVETTIEIEIANMIGTETAIEDTTVIVTVLATMIVEIGTSTGTVETDPGPNVVYIVLIRCDA